VNLHLHP